MFRVWDASGVRNVGFGIQYEGCGVWGAPRTTLNVGKMHRTLESYAMQLLIPKPSTLNTEP